ncbi:MAG TPA: hypothetical protein VIV60_23075, partial [Polyangiaceae bacterium]
MHVIRQLEKATREAASPLVTPVQRRWPSAQPLRAREGRAHLHLTRTAQTLQAALVVLSTCRSIRAETVAVPDQATAPQRERKDSATDADALFAEAQNKILAHDLPSALILLKQCYELTGSYNLLYNMARLQQELLNCSDALANYRLFVRNAVESPWRDDANRQIATLESTCEQPQPTPSAPEPAPTARSVAPPVTKALPGQSSVQPEHAAPWSTIGWVAIGTGTLTSVATVYFAKQAFDAKHQTDAPSGNADAFYARAEELKRNSIYAWTFGVTSVVALGVGVYALVVGARKPTVKSQQLAVIALPH